MNIAIIPARGGSKRLPGKNIKLLAGKPLIAWTIEAAIQSNLFDHVFVSTDCEETAAIAKDFGAKIPFLRPKDLANDTATTNDVVTHLVNWFEQKEDSNVDTIALLQPTSPLRNSLHIREAVNLLKEKSARAIISVCELEHSIQLCNKLNKNGSMEGFIVPQNIQRTQDLETYFRLNGAIYLFKRQYVDKLDTLYSAGSYAYIMDVNSSIDIDTKDDFELAKFYLSNLK